MDPRQGLAPDRGWRCADRRHPRRRRGVYGLTVIADTTPAQYWIGQIVVGFGVVAFTSILRLRGFRQIAAGALMTAVVATAFYVTYSANLIALL